MSSFVFDTEEESQFTFNAKKMSVRERALLESVNKFKVWELEDRYVISKWTGFIYETDGKDIDYDEIIDAYSEYDRENI